jgi:hypothetical protein
MLQLESVKVLQVSEAIIFSGSMLIFSRSSMLFIVSFQVLFCATSHVEAFCFFIFLIFLEDDTAQVLLKKLVKSTFFSWMPVSSINEQELSRNINIMNFFIICSN